MRRHLSLPPGLIIILAALAAAVMTATACFSPRQPACAFSCANPPHTCPADYACADDGFCHRVGHDPDGTCDQGPDGATDAGATDGAVDTVNNND